jgi:hypothetical protein
MNPYYSGEGHALPIHRAILICAAVMSVFAAGLNLCVGAESKMNVLTYHNDNARTGQNLNETILTPANVNVRTFGQLFVFPVDGYVYAQPLYMANVPIPGKGTHNVVFVATEHNSVYAFDADSNAGDNAEPLWQVSFIDPAAGVTTVPVSDFGLTDLPELGITGTPVIDSQSGTLFVVARFKIVKNDLASYEQRLYALDISTGAAKFGGPVVIDASVAGIGDDRNESGRVQFNPFRELQRSGLLLNNGVVYVAFASVGSIRPYHGWILGYDATTLEQRSVFNVTPDTYGGGIWMSGAAPAADAEGNIYCITGNGAFTADKGGTDFADSFLKLTPDGSKLVVADYFTPYNQFWMEEVDGDLGSGGVLLLPDSVGNPDHPHLLVGAGKEPVMYLIDRDDMGRFNPDDNSQIVQSLTGATGGTWSMPAYFNGRIYHQAYRDYLKAFQISNGKLSTNPVSQSTVFFDYPGATPSISANGTNNAIVWAIQADAFSKGKGPAVLHAYNATNLAQELYNSSEAGNRDEMGLAQKFSVPTIANGKVYAGTGFGLSVFGHLTTPVAAPAILVQPEAQTVLAGTTVQLRVTASGSAPLSYQWRFNGTDLPGATNSVLALPRVGLGDAGLYTVSVRNLAGVLTSDPAALKVNIEPVLAPKIDRVQRNGDVVVIQFTLNPTYQLAVEYSDSLTSGTWANLTTVTASTVPSSLVVTDSIKTKSQRFYRLKVVGRVP